MYQNYIFDLYGTLADIRTNENSPYLWRKMSEFYAALGAVYTARGLKLEYRRLVDEAVEKAARSLREKEDWQCVMACPEKQNQGSKWSEKVDLRKETGEKNAKETEKERQDPAKIHAEPDLTEVFAELYRQKGVPCDREQARMTAIMFRTLSRSRLCLYDGVTDFLKQLNAQGKGVYLLSNAQEDFTRPELDLLGLTPYFNGIYISSEQGVKKPSPIFFQRLLKEYRLDPAACIMIGNDEHSDIAGARAVGMDCLYIHTAISPEVTGTVDADYVVMDGDFRNIEGLILL